jgi:hypothetical protein
MNYNYFVYASGLGQGPFTLRVTDFYGQQLVDSNIPLTPDAITNGQANFSSHAGVAVQTHQVAISGCGRALVVAKIGSARSLRGIQSGVYDIYAINGRFMGRIKNTGIMNMLNIGMDDRDGIFIIKPVIVIR